MTSKLLLVFGLIILVFVAYGYSQTITSENSVDNTGPKIAIEPKEFDFGEVEFGKVVEHTFEVKNTGSEVLEIKRVSTSCGCTKARVDKERLGPGEAATLLVTYDSGAMKRERGRIERTVYIKSNDPLRPQVEVRILANVK